MSMEVLTYSRLRLRLNCPYAEHLRYDCLLAPKATGSPRMLGSAVHKGLETGSVAEALVICTGVMVTPGALVVNVSKSETVEV